jgi:hypothetical protein
VIAFLKSLLSRCHAALDRIELAPAVVELVPDPVERAPVVELAPDRTPERAPDRCHARNEPGSHPTRLVRPAVGFGRIYVCHPDLYDPRITRRRVRRICRAVVATGQVPIAPQLYLPTFLDPQRESARALAIRFELISACHELRVYGSTVTREMRREIDHAVALGLPVRFVELTS